MKKALIVDSGARGAALQWAIEQDPEWQAVVMPGNAQTYRKGYSTSSDVEGIIDEAFRCGVNKYGTPDLMIVGPEAYLEEGLADELRMMIDRWVVGPSKKAARLETSKGWARRFMRRHNIPHPKFRIVDSAYDAMLAYDQQFSVLKANGLAAGKGVKIPESRGEAGQAIHEMMTDRIYGDAGQVLVCEERMMGPEISFHVVTDGLNAVPLLGAADKKRRFDGDKGPNTGSMGASCSKQIMSQRLVDEVMEDVVYPTLRGMAAEGYPYQGFLYVSLMLTEDGPKVVEFNVRPGDPEILVILALLKSNFAELMVKCTEPDGLRNHKLEWADCTAVCTVLAHDWYPGKGSTGTVITGLDQAAALQDVLVFQAGTKQNQDGEVITNGGRVVDVVGLGDTMKQASDRSIAAAEVINFRTKAFRRDIALGL
ncbi:MAG TPA: phosphoribosylamine--glycine ligase [Methylomirabilota bacterium]|jgi:phosphoribosylamine--glycine ligase|nr:phosphoribosylamine--glycine ligase [Methylomirabilota bacterium]